MHLFQTILISKDTASWELSRCAELSILILWCRPKCSRSISVYACALFLISASAGKIEQTLNSHTGVDSLLLTLV